MSDMSEETCTEKCARIAQSGCAYVKKSVREYILEFKNTDDSATEARIQAAEEVKEFITKHDVALFVLPGLVSDECNEARSLLLDNLEANQFGEKDVFDHEEAALQFFVGEELKDAPAIFIRGVYLGGIVELRNLVSTKPKFRELLESTPEPLPLVDNVALAVKREPLQLLHQAGGKPFYCFHLFVYGNVVRMISLFQVIFAVICCICIANDKYTAAQVFGTYMFFDCLLLTAWGPSPWSPTGMLATLLVWPRRGPVVTILPYKVIFLFYAILVGRLAMKTKPFGSDSASQQFDGQSEFVTIAINSTLLTVLRF